MSTDRKSGLSRLARWNLKFTPLIPQNRPEGVYAKVLATCIPDDAHWLDIGCGSRLLRGGSKMDQLEIDLVNRAAVVYGIDPSEEHLKRNTCVAVKVVGNAEELPWDDETFDVVSCSMVMEHVENPLAVFSEVSRTLKPNGIFVVHTPNWWAYDSMFASIIPDTISKRITSMLDQRPQQNVFPAYYRCNDGRSFRRLGKQSGFDSVKVDYLLTRGVFFNVPILYQIEMLWMACLRLPLLLRLRPNLVVVLRRAC